MKDGKKLAHLLISAAIVTYSLVSPLRVAAKSASQSTATSMPADETHAQANTRIERTVRAAAVRVSSPSTFAIGFLLGDRRTVIFRGSVANSRPYVVASMEQGLPEVHSVAREVYAFPAPASAHRAILPALRRFGGLNEGDKIIVAKLSKEIPGRPLRISTLKPKLGDAVSVLLPLSDVVPKVEVGQATISATSNHTFSFTVNVPVLDAVLDNSGHLVGYQLVQGMAVSARELMSSKKPVAAPVVVSHFGLRAGWETGGPVESGFVLALEGGFLLWDQLGLVLRVGLAAGLPKTFPVESDAGHGVGKLTGSRMMLDVGLEVTYRWLWSNMLSVYLIPAVGVRFAHGDIVANSEVVLYPESSSCDPADTPCRAVFRDRPEDFGRTTAVGPTFGADLQFFGLDLGYRFTPSALSYQLPDSHVFTVGLVL